MNWRAAWALAALASGAASAQAQSSCEQFRDRLAERMNAAARGYTLEIVPGTTPLPAGAKVVGTCAGGTRKVVFLRIGTPIGGVDGAADAASAPASAPRARPAIAAPVASGPAAEAAPKTATKGPERGQPAASAATGAGKEARGESAEPAAAGAAGSVTSGEPPAPIAAAPQSPRPEPPATTLPGSSDGSAADWLQRHAWWIAVPVGLLLAVPLWIWIAYRRAYDEHGLPRGPRLRA